jgi:1,4-alpha-glucan branching enzyme
MGGGMPCGCAGNGFWEIFVPGVQAGEKYKYEIIARDGRMLPLKSDPLAFAAELRQRLHPSWWIATRFARALCRPA